MIQLLNTNYYKEKTKELKMRIQEGDSEALTEYTKLVQIAKNHKIK
ncbi:MAG: hypothetical protein H6767_09415 [Candidatus Peribacteria bacterium]|nr:MAG: hypothetical protein H6767_09415 [Candidatus Peribacteria bacterium]